jgi:two-component system, OmpR family, response regulator QseB
MHALLVEDDAQLGAAIDRYLRSEGIAVTWLRSADGAIARLRDGAMDAVLLDLRMPGTDGLTWLRAARTIGVDTPVIVISARGALEDRLEGLDIGADDYLVKPFAMAELLARLRAATRRVAKQSHSRWTLGPLCVDESTHEVRVAETPVELTPREFSLLMLLARRQGRVVAKHRIASAIDPHGEPLSPGAIEVHVHSLRRKLGPELVRTVRGVGYMLLVPS